MARTLSFRSINLEPVVDATVVTAGTNYTIQPADKLVKISTTGAGDRTITFPVRTYVQQVTVWMTAFNTAAYTAAVSQGTVTWNAANETATFVSSGDGTNTWTILALQGASVA